MIATRLLMLVLATAGFAVVWSGDQAEQSRIIASRGPGGAAITSRATRRRAELNKPATPGAPFARTIQAAVEQRDDVLRIEYAGRQWLFIPVEEGRLPQRSASRR